MEISDIILCLALNLNDYSLISMSENGLFPFMIEYLLFIFWRFHTCKKIASWPASLPLLQGPPPLPSPPHLTPQHVTLSLSCPLFLANSPWSPLSAAHWGCWLISLTWFCAGHHSCGGLVSAKTMSCPRDSISFHRTSPPSSGSYFPALMGGAWCKYPI